MLPLSAISEDELPDILMELYPIAITDDERLERLEYEISEAAASMCGDAEPNPPLAVSPFWIFCIRVARTTRALAALSEDERNEYFAKCHARFLSYRKLFAKEIKAGSRFGICEMPPIPNPKAKPKRKENRKCR